MLAFFPKALRAKGSRLVDLGVWGGDVDGRLRASGVSAAPPLLCSVALIFGEKKKFPCSVALKVLGVTSAAVRSSIGFSNIWGVVVFIVLHLWRSGALFSDSLWPSVS